MKQCPLECACLINKFEDHLNECKFKVTTYFLNIQDLYNIVYFSCKYNKEHIVHKEDFELHTQSCPNKDEYGIEFGREISFSKSNHPNNNKFNDYFCKKEVAFPSDYYSNNIVNKNKNDEYTTEKRFYPERLNFNKMLNYFNQKSEPPKIRNLQMKYFMYKFNI